MEETVQRAKVWKRVLGAILDFLTIFFVGGYALGRLTGNMTDEGFSLTGAPAVVLFALIVAYFWIGRRYAGGTIWDRIFHIGRPQPAD
jgi:hypothetical protein